MNDHKWTADDNVIANTELVLADFLTDALTARPEMSFHVLFANPAIRKRVQTIREALERDLGHPVHIDVEEYIEPEKRRVVVKISDTRNP